MSEFAEKVVLITGAGRGVGRLLALACAERGAVLALNDISPLNVEQVAEQIRVSDGQARIYLHDVAKKVAVQTMVNQVMDDFGRIDALINCANVCPDTALLDLDEWDLHRVFEVNAIGTLLMMQVVGRVMRQAGRGVILNVVRFPADAPVSYLASRGGLELAARRADEELRPDGIRVFSVSGEDPASLAIRLLQETWRI
ncbi:MAG: SDR family NAD(P)-dependent oxidoreductase [Anaerolineales bacterium]|nr:SDR family NAD(P)-dependent oxidoreductase [Anaerolineales bacterium]